MVMQPVRLISWNVEHRRDLRPHLALIDKRSPDIVALQELNPNANCEELIKDIGLQYVKSTVEIARRQTKPYRCYAVLIASKWKLRVVQHSYVPWPERVLSVVADTPVGDLELHTAYIPCGASHEWIKIRTFRGIFRRLARITKRFRILCGDFNTPKEETKNGLVITWGQYWSQYKKPIRDLAFHKGGGERWDEGERNILTGLARYNLADVYRSLYGYKVQDWSWRDVKRNGVTRRFDHVLASPSMNPQRFKYLGKAVELGLSHHKAAEVDFKPRI